MTNNPQTPDLTITPEGQPTTITSSSGVAVVATHVTITDKLLARILKVGRSLGITGSPSTVRVGGVRVKSPAATPTTTADISNIRDKKAQVVKDLKSSLLG